ncbi:MAG: NTP transferase domain-containing protein [Deltaproteobacteria bacterium]|nr:NTP transferase domain-containing protein [Deltaproteobacteria bacterium]
MGGAAKGLLTSPSGGTVLAAQRSALSLAGIPHVLVGEHPAYAREELEVLRDDPRAEGPLGGVLALLDRAQGRYAIVLGCDMPFLDARTLHLLLDAPPAPAVAPRRGGRWEPFFARYEANVVLPIAIALAEDGGRSLQAMLDRVESRELHLGEGRAQILDDWDTPEDVRATLAAAAASTRASTSISSNTVGRRVTGRPTAP